MSNHCGKGRQVNEVNLDKELYLQFNLPTMETFSKTMLNQIVEEKILKQGKLYICKNVSKKFSSQGAAVGTLRKQEELKSHMPSNLYENNCDGLNF